MVRLILFGCTGLLTHRFLLSQEIQEFSDEGIFSNIGYTFKDSSLVESALTHKSFSSSNNERLEFLGDALINLYISERLFKTYEGLDEGKLTRFKASMVSRDNLNLKASKLNIGNLIKLGREKIRR